MARLGDARALPSLLAALDGDVDAWRAIQVAGHLPQAADQLVSRLCDHLRRIDLSQQWTETSANAILSALVALGDTAAVPVVVDTLDAAVRHEQNRVTRSALNALGAFGPAATGAQHTIRSLTTAADAHVRPAAVAALWAVGGDLAEVMPLLLGLLDDPITFRISGAADLLGEMGPRASVALPRLRGLLTHDYEWVRVHCAAALWEIGGEAEASAVLYALLQAMARNSATANHVVACLDRMGPLAAPALPCCASTWPCPGAAAGSRASTTTRNCRGSAVLSSPGSKVQRRKHPLREQPEAAPPLHAQLRHTPGSRAGPARLPGGVPAVMLTGWGRPRLWSSAWSASTARSCGPRRPRSAASSSPVGREGGYDGLLEFTEGKDIASHW
ncbi:HEAT repeat domain-containing protein [Streptomyces sp. NPDC002573]|uniref:HEAT repeat domain-containing protein n=1 Tax=Streptomyces sp. NPDC002573 TaxID=3364651 RepID=UPI0036C726FB